MRVPKFPLGTPCFPTLRFAAARSASRYPRTVSSSGWLTWPNAAFW